MKNVATFSPSSRVRPVKWTFFYPSVFCSVGYLCGSIINFTSATDSHCPRQIQRALQFLEAGGRYEHTHHWDAAERCFQRDCGWEAVLALSVQGGVQGFVRVWVFMDVWQNKVCFEGVSVCACLWEYLPED